MVDNPQLSKVGGTALIVANCRARLSRVAHPWFVDPLALHLAQRCPDWDSQPLDRGLVAWVAVRTRFLDQLLVAAVGDGLRQVVILGAGLDGRAFRLPFPAGTQVFEVDRADVLDIKAAAVQQGGLQPMCARTVVVADLMTDDWAADLAAAGWDSAGGTVWIAEGLLIYFEQSAREELLRTMRHTGSGSDIFGATMTVRSVLPDDSQWKVLPDETLPAWFGRCGWSAQVRTMADVSADYGWPITVAGRGLAQLVRATAGPAPLDPATPTSLGEPR